jgi:hypothetical protein
MEIIIVSVYILLLVFVLAVIFLKIYRKEKVRLIWYCALCVLIILPLLWLIIIGSFSVSPPEVVEQITPN